MQTDWTALHRKLLPTGITTSVCIFVFGREVSYAVVAPPGENSLVDCRDFVWCTYILTFIRATGIDPLIIQNWNICLLFLLFYRLLVHSSSTWGRCLTVVCVTYLARDASWKEDDFLSRRRVGDWLHFVWRFARVHVFPILIWLFSTTFNSTSTAVWYYDTRILWRVWLLARSW